MGIEVSRSLGDDATWDCWLRRDTAGRYSRFIHIRRVKMQSDVIVPIEALTGQTWDPSNKLYGSMYTPAGRGGFAPSKNASTGFLWAHPRGASPNGTIRAGGRFRNTWKKS
jgi:hypothetical protein